MFRPREGPCPRRRPQGLGRIGRARRGRRGGAERAKKAAVHGGAAGAKSGGRLSADAPSFAPRRDVPGRSPRQDILTLYSCDFGRAAVSTLPGRGPRAEASGGARAHPGCEEPSDWRTACRGRCDDFQVSGRNAGDLSKSGCGPGLSGETK